MSDDVAKSLIAALADGGEHIDDGAFTVDAAAAFRKLREHQLDDPHRYVLLLIEAAWLAAEDLDRAQVQIALGSTTLAGTASVFDFRGIPLPRGSLRELFATTIGKTIKLEGEALRRARILQLLGLAANNALALGPKRIIIEASDANGIRERLRIEPSGALTLEPCKASAPGSVRFIFAASMLPSSRTMVERSVLEGCCRYTRLAIRVDHHLISQRTDVDVDRGLDPHSGKPSSAVVVLDNQAIGVVGPHRNPDARTNTWIVNRGVALADPRSAVPGLQAVVEVDLPLDLTRKQLLERPELEAVRAAIADARARIAEPVRPPAGAPLQQAGPRPWGIVVLLIFIMLSSIATCLLDSKQERDREARMFER